MSSVVGLLVVLYMLVGGIAFALWAVNWVMRPLRQRSRDSFRSTQFTLADLIALLVVVQVLLSAIVAGIRSNDETLKLAAVCVVMYGVAYVVCWYSGVRALFLAGIVGFWRRTLFLSLVMPSSVLATMVFVFSSGLTLATLQGASFFVAIVSLAVLLFCGWYTRVALDGPPQDSSVAGESEQQRGQAEADAEPVHQVAPED